MHCQSLMRPAVCPEPIALAVALTHTAGRILCFISRATVRCLHLFTLSGTLALDLEESSGDGVEARRDQTLRPDDQGDAIVVVLSSRGGHYQ